MTEAEYNALSDAEKSYYYVLDNNGKIEYITLSQPASGDYTTRYRVHLDATQYQGLDESLLYPYKTNTYTRTITEAEYKSLSDKTGWSKIPVNAWVRKLTAAELLPVEMYVYEANGSRVTKSSLQSDEFVLKNGERCMIVGLPYGGNYMITETKATDANGADIASNYIITPPTMPLTVRTLDSTTEEQSISLDQKVFDNFYQPKTSLIVSKTVVDDDNRANPDAVYLFRLVDKDGNAVKDASYTIAANSGTTENAGLKTDANGYFTLKPASFGKPVTAEFNLPPGTYKIIEVDPNQVDRENYLSGVSDALKAEITSTEMPILDTTLRDPSVLTR